LDVNTSTWRRGEGDKSIITHSLIQINHSSTTFTSLLSVEAVFVEVVLRSNKGREESTRLMSFKDVAGTEERGSLRRE